MIPQLLQYFAIALICQFVFLIVFGAGIIGAEQYEAHEVAKVLLRVVFMLYAWPFGPGGIFLSAPILLVIYSLVFSVVKVRLRNR